MPEPLPTSPPTSASASTDRSGGDPVKVLFVLGSERSGTTIIGSLLSQVEGWFGGGEIRRVWHDLATEPTRCGCGRDPWQCQIWASIGPRRLDPRCGCGRPLQSCDVWPVVSRQALDRAGGGLTPADVVPLQQSVVRYQHTWRALPRLLRERTRQESPELTRYVALTGELFRSLKEVTGCRVVVDTSKETTDALVLSMVPDIDLYLLHVVRDPRGVLYSTYRRYSPVPETGFADSDPRSTRPRQAGYVSAHWTIRNFSADLLARGRRRSPLLRLSYEDFVRRPGPSLEAVTRFAGEGGPALPRLDDVSVELQPSHTVTGNRTRFRAGTVEVQPDSEWERNLHPADTAISTMLTLPLLRRYGYPLRRPTGRTAPVGG